MTFGEKVIRFHEVLRYTGDPLPDGIRVMNPFSESTAALNNIRVFAKKYLNDGKARHIILGINPSRFGAAVTGIPFTDTKRLVNECKIQYTDKPTHEISSVFMYEMINAFGGVQQTCFCLGTGDNARFINRLNNEHRFFGKIIPLEHPRFIMQYKSAAKGLFINKYITTLNSVSH